MFDLPTSLEVCGVYYDIRSDYRAALTICAALSDDTLKDEEKVFVLLDVLYEDFADMPPEHYKDAVKQGLWFIGGGNEKENKKSPVLMNWEQDFKHIVAPINRIIGHEVRSVEYMHWWTFVSFYYEIGDCFFAQIIRIRDKKANGKKLEKDEREFYKRNREAIDLKVSLNFAEKEILKEWT